MAATKTEARPAASATRSAPFLVELYRSAMGKKYVMAVSGIVMMGYVFAHMVGNLKLYLGTEADGTPKIDHYAEWLRTGLGTPILPEEGVLWIFRLVLLAALVFHVHAAWALTVMNRRARPDGYRSKRDYISADFASRTMRWTGVIVLLFIGFHLADLTFGSQPAASADYVYGDVYANIVASFQRPAVAAFYIVANLALGVHLYHGGWSLFQTLGVVNPRYNHLRRSFAVVFAAVVVLGNISFPVAVLTGIVA